MRTGKTQWSEPEYELLVAAATDAAWVFDPQTGEIHFDGVDHFGYDAYTESRDWWADRVHPDDRERVLAQDAAAFAGEASALDRRNGDRGHFTIEYRWQRADGSYADCLERGIVAFADDTAVRMAGTISEITARKEAEAELERQNARLEQFASVVSHDLRNPLNVASGRLELAQDSCDSEQLSHIEAAHDRMEALIDNLLTLAREGQAVTSVAEIDIGAIANQSWNHVDTGSADLHIADSQLIRADENRLVQLYENLFRNAIEHGGDAVTITVGTLDNGFYLADDGPGLSGEEQDNLFEIGYSTKPSGTGFGLAIVKEIVDAHDWEISVTTSAAGGARFECTDLE